MTSRLAPSLLSSRILSTARISSSAKSFSSIPALRRKTEEEHVLNTDNELDIQSKASKSGRREAASDASSPKEAEKHSSATSGQDTNGSASKQKEKNPKSPNTGGPKGSEKVMGMQDERGGKGH